MKYPRAVCMDTSAPGCRRIRRRGTVLDPVLTFITLLEAVSIKYSGNGITTMPKPSANSFQGHLGLSMLYAILQFAHGVGLNPFQRWVDYCESPSVRKAAILLCQLFRPHLIIFSILLKPLSIPESRLISIKTRSISPSLAVGPSIAPT